jgi:DNA repair protein RAD50
MDTKIAEAQVPIDLLDQEHKQRQNEQNSRVAEAQRLVQELNISVDKLDGTNKAIERYL